MRKSVVGVGVALLAALGACSAQTTGSPAPDNSADQQSASTTTDAVQLVALARTSTSKSRTVKIDATVDTSGAPPSDQVADIANLKH